MVSKLVLNVIWIYLNIFEYFRKFQKIFWRFSKNFKDFWKFLNIFFKTFNLGSFLSLLLLSWPEFHWEPQTRGSWPGPWSRWEPNRSTSFSPWLHPGCLRTWNCYPHRCHRLPWKSLCRRWLWYWRQTSDRPEKRILKW